MHILSVYFYVFQSLILCLSYLVYHHLVSVHTFTGIGLGLRSCYLTNQPDLTQPGHPFVGRRKGAITSKIKHAIKLKTSPARLAQLLQPSLAFCFSLQPMTTHWTVRCHLPQAKNANEGCNSCASLAGLVLSFITCFILLVIAP